MSLSKNTDEKVFRSSFCRALAARLQKNIHFQHDDATRYFDYTSPFYIEISSPVNYTAIIVHMGVPSPNVRRRCEQVTEEKGINPGKLSYYYTQSRPFVRRWCFDKTTSYNNISYNERNFTNYCIVYRYNILL